MIQFTCPGCGRAFAVPEQFAGRKANCKNCGGPLIRLGKGQPGQETPKQEGEIISISTSPDIN